MALCRSVQCFCFLNKWLPISVPHTPFISFCRLRINRYLYINFWLNYSITLLRKYYYNVTIVITMFVPYVCLFFLIDSERSYSPQWSAKLPHSHLEFTASQIYPSCHANSPQWPQPPPKCWASQSPNCYWGLSCWRGTFKKASEQVDARYSLHASYSVHDIKDACKSAQLKKNNQTQLLHEMRTGSNA